MLILQRREPQRRPESEVRTEGLERLLAFSDGVFAIAITLLILDIHLPGIETPLTNAQLFGQLLALWPKIFAYLLSFGVVAIFWVKHHTTFRRIKAFDAHLIWLNMALLLVVSFVPFPTAVMSAQRNGAATALYALTMALGFALSAAIWWHVMRDERLVAEDFDAPTRRAVLVSALVPCAVFLLSAAVALIDSRWGRVSLLLMIPASNSHLWDGTARERSRKIQRLPPPG